jgi:hypothetical protein
MSATRWIQNIAVLRPAPGDTPTGIEVATGMEVDDGTRALSKQINYYVSWTDLPATGKTKLADLETDILAYLQTLDPVS